MQREPSIARHLADLRAPGPEADEEEPRRDPRLDGMHPRRAVGPERGLEAHGPVQPLATERRELGLGAFELGPGGHRGLP